MGNQNTQLHSTLAWSINLSSAGATTICKNQVDVLLLALQHVDLLNQIWSIACAEMVFCYVPKLFWSTLRENCSSDWEKLFIFEAKGREFAKFLRALEQFIQTVKGQNNFLVTECFLTCSWRFLISNKNENNYNSNWKKLLGFRNMLEKLEKNLYQYT